MEFDKLVKDRYSLRSYSEKPIEKEKLDNILESSVLAPTAANRQAFKIYVIEPKSSNREGLQKIYEREWFCKAPVIVCVCSIKEQSWVRNDGTEYYMVDAAIVMDHLILAATNEGLGSCWIAAFNKEEAKSFLKLEEGIEPVVFATLGYKEEGATPPAKKRKPLSTLIEYID